MDHSRKARKAGTQAQKNIRAAIEQARERAKARAYDLIQQMEYRERSNLYPEDMLRDGDVHPTPTGMYGALQLVLNPETHIGGLDPKCDYKVYWEVASNEWAILLHIQQDPMWHPTYWAIGIVDGPQGPITATVIIPECAQALCHRFAKKATVARHPQEKLHETNPA